MKLGDIILGAAPVLAGAWALYRYVLFRSAQPALTIGVETEATGLQQGKATVLVTAVLSNVGKVRIRAKPNREARVGVPGLWAYNDGYDCLPFACTLEVRQLLDMGPFPSPGRLSWYELDDVRCPRISPDKIDLLEEYFDEAAKETDFWVEPGETYHSASALILPPGRYLAKVTFVGMKEDDYWSRIFAFSVGS